MAEEIKTENKKHLIIAGKTVHYDALHKSLRQKYGRAFGCVICGDKSERRYEWALKHGHEYSYNIEDYQSMCCPCHRKYDFTENDRERCRILKKGKYKGVLNPAAKKVYDTNTKKIFGTVGDAAKSVGLKRTTLVMMLRGKNPNKTSLVYYEQP